MTAKNEQQQRQRQTQQQIPCGNDKPEKQNQLHLFSPTDFNALSHLVASTYSSRSTRSASATSSKGTAPSAKICTFSCPLPASSTISPGFAERIATSIAARRSSSTMKVVCVSRTPNNASLMIDIGSSLRGLSLVTMTRSLSSPAARPIFGRFVLSRSPPQPNIVITRPPCPTT